MKEKLTQLLLDKYDFLDNETDLKYKFLFLKNIIIFAIVIAFFMAIKRYFDGNTVVATIDITFSSVLLLFYSFLNKKRFEIISHIIIFITFIMSTMMFIYAPHQSSIVSLYIILVISIIFLKGRYISGIYIILIFSTVAYIYFGTSIKNNYSITDLILAALYTIAAYLIASLYEDIKIAHDVKLNELLNKGNSENAELKQVVESFDKYVIFSKTDLKGRITYVSDAFCKISGYTKEELVGQGHNIVRHPDMPSLAFKELWSDLKSKGYWRGEVKNKTKDGGFYWVDAIIESDYGKTGKHIGYHALRQNITSQKEVETLKQDLEKLNDHLEAQNDEKIIEVIKLTKDIKDTQKEIIFTMGTIGEIRSKETGNHVKRVAEYTKLLALYSGIHEFDAEMLRQASPMHDIGKIGIADAILNKPGRLTTEEMDVMKTHARLGFDMLKHSDKKLLGIAATVAHEHHERFDGTGYPNGLKGENISIEGRITAVADVFDALGSARAYKKAWSDEDIVKMFIEEKGKHFDPDLIDIFLENKQDFIDIRNKFVD